MALSNDKPFINPNAILREEFDDWAILLDPDSGDGFGLNPTSVFIFKLIDGKNSIPEIISKVRAECEDVPDDAETHVHDFLKDLESKGFIGFEIQRA